MTTFEPTLGDGDTIGSLLNEAVQHKSQLSANDNVGPLTRYSYEQN